MKIAWIVERIGGVVACNETHPLAPLAAAPGKLCPAASPACIRVGAGHVYSRP